VRVEGICVCVWCVCKGVGVEVCGVKVCGVGVEVCEGGACVVTPNQWQRQIV